jgi:hypothetical protein
MNVGSDPRVLHQSDGERERRVVPNATAVWPTDVRSTLNSGGKADVAKGNLRYTPSASGPSSNEIEVAAARMQAEGAPHL